ncbi:MAG: S41 family peptidase [Bacteroidota bacterium]
MNQWTTRIAGGLAALIGLIGLASTVAPTNDRYFEMMKSIEIYTNVYKELNTYYVDEVEPSQLMRIGIEAMVSSLDPYTNFISESDVERARLRQSGQYQGIGADMRLLNDRPTIMELFRDQPADQAGLKVGDRILEVDGQNTEGRNLEQLEEIMRGFPGTIMELVVERPGSGRVNISLTRGDLNIQNVPYYGMLDQNVGYVALTTFTRQAAKNVRDAVQELRADNPAMQGVVLDLRYNGGGLLNEAVDIVNIWAPRDELIVSTRGKVREWDRSYKTNGNPLDLEMPVAVLVNGRSASASEIVSGALQDLDRAIIIGQQTYGKGLVQNIMETGYSSRVKITTAKYYIPSNRCIQALNYVDGEPVDIPDDQRAVFQTRAGRPVLDGGGVAPDVELPVLGDNPVTKSLIDNNILFDYVNQWVLDRPTIDTVTEFRFTDWDNFMGFLSEGDYAFTSETERLLEKALEEASTEGYPVDTELAALQATIDAQQTAAINEYKTEIIKMIEKEIASRYYYQRGRVQMGLRNDAEVVEAISILTDPARYNEILKP